MWLGMSERWFVSSNVPVFVTNGDINFFSLFINEATHRSQVHREERRKAKSCNWLIVLVVSVQSSLIRHGKN